MSNERSRVSGGNDTPRQLVDALPEPFQVRDRPDAEPGFERYIAAITRPEVADLLVASLLADGPAEHEIVCPTCLGVQSSYEDHVGPCPDCTDGRVRVQVRAEIVKPT